MNAILGVLVTVLDEKNIMQRFHLYFLVKLKEFFFIMYLAL